MEILNEIQKLANPEQAIHLSKFFKTGKGDYGEGDVFLGIKVPITRLLVKKYSSQISINEIDELITSKYHEVRLFAILSLVELYQKNNDKEIYEYYLSRYNYINNWDLVDLSAPKIVGNYSYNNKINSDILKFSQMNNLWANRIAIVSQLYPIKKGEFSLTKSLAEKFFTHKHDLIHKAVGWMLREMGKVDIDELYKFLDKNTLQMPRTSLRYAIERLPETKRKYYLKLT